MYIHNIYIAMNLKLMKKNILRVQNSNNVLNHDNNLVIVNIYSQIFKFL